jgi:alpha-beta hydrolase superfamily lysophospholipase
MDVLTLVIAVPAALFVLWLAAVAFAGFGIPGLPDIDPQPARDDGAALRAFEVLSAADGPEVSPAARTQLLRPQGPARGTLVLWHGFTNCPAQFAEVAEILCAEGFFVLVARIPRHGNSDTMTRDLEGLIVEEIATFANDCVDVAAGLPTPLSVVGFSVGGGLAAWMGARRAEVERVVCISPLVAPRGIPVWVVRLVVRLRSVMPHAWIWWDPRKKEKLNNSPHVYPGFPMTGLIPFLHVGMSLHDKRVQTSHRLKRAALITNPRDLAVRNGPAARMMTRVFAGHADTVMQFALAGSLGWWHDFIDQYGAGSADPEQIAELLMAALGEDGAPTPPGVVATVVELDEGVPAKA